MKTISELENRLSTPTTRLIKDVTRLEGDIIILGVGGKMGPSLAKLLKRALMEAGKPNEVIGVSRFSDPATREELANHGIKTIKSDLLNEEELRTLPITENVIFMAGHKFGTQGNEHFTWVMNAYLPGRIAEKYNNSRIVVFSTGNVYPFTSIDKSGPREDHPLNPVGEYALSCLGRERVFQHFSIKNETPTLIFRLNYAIDLRYGVLLEIGKSIWDNQTVDLNMGYVNVIWQGDANEFAIRALNHCKVPPEIVNVTGAEILSVKELAEKFGKAFKKVPQFVNKPQPTALLSNPEKAYRIFGEPLVSVDQMINWCAEWIKRGGEELNKPTHFQERKGKF